MKKHIMSFLKCPLGYVANLIASAAQYGPRWLDEWFISPWNVPMCEMFCDQSDPLQNDPLF